MRLVIVESPKKARTIQGFLGSGYRVAASMGHVRDLPTRTLGVDVGADFAPQYEVPVKSQKTLSSLRQAARAAESVLLATDPDREGEAIAWHLAEALRLPRTRYRRITFHEISRRAIQEALAHPRDLDSHLIDAQQARRVLDRLVGYGLSPLLWRKVQRGTSAGRVQSVAVRLVVDREREIRAFVPEEYWTIDARLCPQGADTESFLARLIEIDGKKAEIPDAATSERLVVLLDAAHYVVSETSKKTTQRNPFPPFTTSTLQQAAGNRLRMPAKKAMSAAQSLYEAGLITYMRTDSVSVSGEAIAQARKVIAVEFGPEYVPEAPRRYSTRSKNAQEAHEAIRPVDLAKTPASLRGSLVGDEWRVYDLIWKRMIASQMPPARYLQDVAMVEGRVDPTVLILKAQASTLVFPGWLAAYGEEPAEPAAAGNGRRRGKGQAGAKDTAEQGEQEADAPANARLPKLEARQPLDLQDVLPEQHFTQPPRRYTEASLVKAMEDAGVGRPSTYAAVVSTIQDRGYVQLEQRHFVPTELGFAANDFLVAHFPNIVDLPFTARMEDELDEIAGGRLGWTHMLRTFYGPFEQTIARAQSAAVTELKRQEGPAPVGAVSAARPSAAVGAGAGGTRAGASRAATARTGRTRARGTRARRGSVAPSAARSPSRSRTVSFALRDDTSDIDSGPSLRSGRHTEAPRESREAPRESAPSTRASGSCPQCGKPLVQRQSQYGAFLGCSGFPACRYIQREAGEKGKAVSSKGRTAIKRPVSRGSSSRPPPRTKNYVRGRSAPVPATGRKPYTPEPARPPTMAEATPLFSDDDLPF